MDDWIDGFADRLGERRLDPKEAGAILKLAREVAHGVERRLAPLAAYVAGMYVGREATEGTSPVEALAEALDAARSRVPEGADDAPAGDEAART
jgi:Domain of unknown function (DUF6457)